MTDQQIIYNNILIAEFMEFELSIINKCYHCTFIDSLVIVPPKDMEFHKNWNWLMLIVEKIEQAKINKFGSSCQVTIMNKSCSIINSLTAINIILRVDKTRIKATYQAVVEFIKWYNKREK